MGASIFDASVFECHQWIFSSELGSGGFL